MKVVLSVPSYWRQDPQYHGTLYGEPHSTTWLLELGSRILAGLKRLEKTYAPLPDELQVEVDWIQDNTSPHLCRPTLKIDVDGNADTGGVIVNMTTAMASIVVELRRVGFAQLIPGYFLALNIACSACEGPIDG